MVVVGPMYTSARIRSSPSMRSAASWPRRPWRRPVLGMRRRVMWSRSVLGAGGVGYRGLPASVCASGARSADCRGSRWCGCPEVDGSRPGPRHVPGANPIRLMLWRWPGPICEPDLPVASHDEVSRELKLLVDRRESLSPNVLRRSTGCCGESMNWIQPALPRPVRWTWPSIRAPSGLAGYPVRA